MTHLTETLATGLPLIPDNVKLVKVADKWYIQQDDIRFSVGHETMLAAYRSAINFYAKVSIGM